MTKRVLSVLGLCAWLIVQISASRRAVEVWHSDLTLWAHARAVAPLKLRPFLNYEKALEASR